MSELPLVLYSRSDSQVQNPSSISINSEVGKYSFSLLGSLHLSQQTSLRMFQQAVFKCFAGAREK